jgi:hypothetical protein
MTVGLLSSRRSRAPRPGRDMDESAFSRILSELVGRIPGAHGAVLVDNDGESVDYAGWANTFELRVCAAHWKIIINEIGAQPSLGTARSLIVRSTTRSFFCHVLPDGYAVVILLGRRAGFAASPRALAVCERELRCEAGWPPASVGRPWFVVNITTDVHRRPVAIRMGCSPALPEIPIEVLGRLVGLNRAHRGYRARLENGAEVTLVRESGSNWYADEDLAASSLNHNLRG